MLNVLKKLLAIVGLQWGDEGKGKIVDLFAERYDCVARYQGGHNAGHTVFPDGKKFVLHLIPSGIFHKQATCVIGSGVVIDPTAFFKELDEVIAAGAQIENRLFVSNRSHVILPWHRIVEAAREESMRENAIGTTMRGMGPAYEDKAARLGIRVCDLLDSDGLAEKIRIRAEYHNGQRIRSRQLEYVHADRVIEEYSEYAERIRPFVIDSASYLNHLIRVGKSVLFEGAQASLLDVDHGTFPFVTSSSPGAGGIPSGLGIAPKYVQQVIGITKPYTTRVGAGPFPTEAHGKDGDTLRKVGVELGASTGRPRRCGWFDSVAGRYTRMLNDPDYVAVTKLDVLDVFEEIPVCVGYKYKGSPLWGFPAEASVLAKVEPVYRTMRGWMTDTRGCRDWSGLPTEAQDYVKLISDQLEVHVSHIGTGPGRADIIEVPLPPALVPTAM